MKLIEIKNTKGKVIYSHKCDDNTVKITVEKAISENVNLSYANLYNDNLSNADLSNANLHNANLYNDNLSNADLHNANLYNANLQDANLRNANFNNANLDHADLRYAKNYYSFIAYDTSRRIVHCIKHNKTWMIRAGCFWGTLEELENKVKATHNSKVYLANIEILKQL